MRYSDIANETFFVSFLFRRVEKILFRLISFKTNNPNHITVKEKIQERFHGKKNKIFHVQKYKLVDFLNGDMQIAVNTHGTIRS